MEATVRKATLDDLDTLYRFEQGIITAERPFDSTLKDGHINYYDLRAMLTVDHVEIAVAELNGEIIGSGYARIENTKPFLKHPQHAFLGFMFVDSMHRGKGINKLVIDYLKQWAKNRGMTELRLQVYDDNLPAVKAYEKIGFSKLLVEMRLGIE